MEVFEKNVDGWWKARYGCEVVQWSSWLHVHYSSIQRALQRSTVVGCVYSYLRYGSKEGFVPAAYLARYRGVVGQSASPVEGVASPKDALSPTAGRKAKQDNASITQSPTPFTPGPTQKKSGYDDERKLLCELANIMIWSSHI